VLQRTIERAKEMVRVSGKGVVREKGGLMEETQARTKFFLAHETKDFLIPIRFYRKSKERLEQLLVEGRGSGEGRLECHEYEGMGHVTCGQEFLDLCRF